MENKNIELISAKLCPFVQRSVITLLEKQVEFNIRYVDLSNKPDWFLSLSPFGKVPLLRIGETTLFESSVILEYLDEEYLPSLHPKSTLRRAENRAEIEFGSSLLVSQYMLWNSASHADFEKRLGEVNTKLQQIEDRLDDTLFYNGDALSLVDIAYAPAFMRFSILEKIGSRKIFSTFPKIKAWSDTVLKLDAVKNSVVPEFEQLFTDAVTEKRFELV
ncbi:glutathione S-transferase family protein [Flexibacterium corallicola]|uniref:glutathione S-transferase family protein n=1 Tax=Flexibacterium corallicola TaxID=3037259 RepID=UPI00286F6AC3|nr:glutathione S-transferase family protein [Pseudovibrio sp. M1P-2-3]